MPRKCVIIVLIFPENPFSCVNIRMQNINFEFERSIIILDDFSHIFNLNPISIEVSMLQ